jgi:hypothetical protein
MNSILDECQQINDVFETEYIYKSLIICNDPSHVYHMLTILKQSDFPVELLSYDNFNEMVYKYSNGNVRMLILSDMLYHILESHWEDLFKDVTKIFLTSKTKISHQFYKTLSKKFISLSI